MKLDKFIERPVLSTVISIFILLLGIIGISSLPITQYPDIAPPTVEVTATYTGANAQTVMNSVVAPIEEEINGVENMTYITSTANNIGQATISVYFKQGTDADMAAVNVQNRVAKAQGLLPEEVTKIGVSTSKKQSSMLMSFSIFSSDDKYSQSFLENYMDINIIPEIKRIQGVGEVEIMGTNYAMRIWLKPEVMSQYKLMPTDIIAALSEQNIEAAPGQFGESGNQSFQYVLKYKGRLQTELEFEDIVIRASENGEVLRLKDIARIELGRFANVVDARINGHEGSSCMIYQVAGSNATEIIKNIETFLDKTQKDLPKGVEITIMLSTNDFLYASIWSVIRTLLEAFVLVFIVTYIFLQNMRSTLIPVIAIPIALIGTFFFLWIFGFSINLLTLCALVLAIAIVVDDAIVVVEAVQAKIDTGYKSSRLASIDAMNEISGAILSITFVMMAVFIPVSFMGGTNGTFYRQMGLTMAFSIAISALNALTLSPALCALLLKPEGKEEDGKKSTFVSRFHNNFNENFKRISGRYKVGVLFCIKHKWASCASVIVAIAAFIFLIKTTPTAMVPNEDVGTIFGVVTMPVGTSLEKTTIEMHRIDSLIASAPGIESRSEVVGYSIIDGIGSSYGTFICRMKNWSERDQTQSMDAVLGFLYANTPQVAKDARVIYFAPPMIPGYSMTNGFELKLQDKTGGSLEKFGAVSDEFLAKLNARPEIAVAMTAFNPSFPQYMIDIDVAQCKKAGVTPNLILTTLQGYYGGIYASDFNRFGKMYRVMIQADASFRSNPETLNKIMIRNGNTMAPISQFVSLRRVYGPDNISRFNLYTAININGSPANGYSSGEAIQAIKEVAQELPVGFGYEFAGMTREEQQSGNSTAIVLGLVFIFIYLLLSAQYESYILPLVILLSIPFGLAGSIIFARLMGAENNIYLQIALIMLIGLLGKNSILIVEYASAKRKKGMTISKAAIEAAGARLRPILMTSLALVIGLLPMMFAHGVGANGNSTLGAGAVGGMLIGMIFQIFITPALFVVFQNLQEYFSPINWKNLKEIDVEAEINHQRKHIND